ncbi:amino acid permease [Microbacterium sp. LMI12-1-1.1]|uniref:APC family permease n=1 Tax=Microbacterium sp. LMI12-1-1.1 TaxID=3135225 RepID=UPI0034133A52
MTSSSLQRRLGLGDAVFIGLGSMIGAGVFAVWAPAADAAGTGLLIGLAIAAIVAFGNATSSAQLAAAHPTSGGTYAYGRAELGPWWGFVAGWGFVVGKIASCAAMALTFAAYVAPAGWERPVAIVAVVALTAVNWFGVTRTAGAARVIVVISLGALAAAVTAAFSADAASSWFSAETVWEGGGYGILQSAGLLFFAFAGYARIATMGEEVRDPRRVIPRAIVIAFLVALAVYAVVAVAVLSALGPAGVAASTEPVADAAARSGWGWIGVVVRVGAAAASLGALLALIAGVSRTAFAMSREGDLPRLLDRVHPRWGVPHRAEVAAALVAVALVALVDLRGAIGFSSFGVLLYYFVANVAAFRQAPDARRYPMALQIIGAIGCLVLAATLPWQSVVGGVIVVAAGVLYRAIRLRVARRD